MIFRASQDIALIKEGLLRFSDKRCAMLVESDKDLEVALECGIKEVYATKKVGYQLETYLLNATTSDLKEGAAGLMVEANDSTDFMELKQELKSEGLEVKVLAPTVAWSELKLDANGLIPVVVQDYLTEEVLMLAYMNEEAYYTTLKTGRMTYYSRSRQEQWMKGLTSGHFQYVKTLRIDCDKDTILARVAQVGAACHTGNKTCFYTDIASREEERVNPYKVLERDYKVIENRKNHPKEGSYTNYLFDKGLDKILKKVGEEATEIVIAAKNEKDSAREVTYEIADFLYHLMVLMADKGISWEDVARELVNRSN
ncbi:Phosphoribosyl-AMP cyclohydrolase / Phosphoribosyl-ATP pyrophosphatase [Lachnospiraceae bacterium TWA4]|nr:Phosphoribosyl-AMP cyclohydrolase / Phosphoribosyl-ATP pyrophosphatase [Lachnospiraceae bacterium TWA4]